MTAQNHFTHFHANCKVNEIDGSFYLTGSFEVRADIAAALGELDQIVDLADHIGQRFKQQIATATINEADQRAVRLVQEVVPHCHKHGTRPFTIITPFARLKVNRQRLFDTTINKAFIPSAKLCRNTWRGGTKSIYRYGIGHVRVRNVAGHFVQKVTKENFPNGEGGFAPRSFDRLESQTG